MPSRRLRIRASLGLAAGLLAIAASAVSAQAAQEITSFTSTLSTSQAGDHPDIRTSFVLKDAGQPEVARNVIFNMPTGIYGNPSAVTQCTSVDFALQQCPPNAQAGLITLRANYKGNPNFLLGTAPIYSVVSGDEEAARFAFVAPTLGIPIAIPVQVRSATDYGLRFTVSGITQLSPLAAADLTFWGFPGEPSHEPERFPKGTPGNPAGCPGLADTSCLAGVVRSTLPLRPLTGNPSICTGLPLTATLDVQTYQDPTVLSHASVQYPAISACDRPTFSPVTKAKLTTTSADTPTGLDLEISAPQTLGLAASPSELRSAVITLPDGLTINPDAADGQTACADADAGFGTERPDGCPDSAKIGTFSISSTALVGPLEGAIYFGEPKPGNQYRLFMMADGYGIHAKLIGNLLPDPKTGRLTAEFRDLPQLPFETFGIHLFASDRGVLATPTRCTLYRVESTLFPWNSRLPDQRANQTLSIDSGPNGRPCPAEIRPFNPRLVAGTSKPTAGAFSDFALKLDRDDGDQFLGDLNFSMPPGLTGSLRGITYCPEGAIARAAQALGRTEQAAPSCPSSSAIGTSNVAAGPGGHPFHAYGKIYMAGPFKGAPLSLVAVTPALAGPYDYGVVVVRVAIDVDKNDAHVIAVSDTVPSIIGGVPIRMRSIEVHLDRPNFMINPTNCSPFSVESQGIGDQRTVANFSSFFRASDCGTLGFAPKMRITQLGGKGKTARSQDPSMRFDLTTRPGDANIKSLAVTLSKAFAIDQRHLGNLCSENELVRTKCAGRQAIGTAITTTPLLDGPLAGPVYAVSGSGGLPRLAFVLDGQVSLLPRAQSSSVKSGALKTVVPIVPDAPIGKFSLTLFGGKKGYLVNTRSLCAAPTVSAVEYVAQNGKKLTQKVRTKAACGGKKRTAGKS
jgi:hypothetical protein